MHLLPEPASHHVVSIPELFVSRDERRVRQYVWFRCHPVPLVSFTVVAPRSIRDSEVTRRVFNHDVTALCALAAKRGWRIQEQATLVSASGPEGMLSITAPVRNFKLATIELEHSHPLGRLQDIDVLAPESEILSCHDYPLPPHCCLLCEQSAVVCARGGTHQLTDLLSRMEALLNDIDACNVSQNHKAYGVANR